MCECESGLDAVCRTGLMDPAEELKQISTWLSEEGLHPDSPQEAQLCLLWRALQRTRTRLSNVTRELETHRSQHLAEMAEVRKSLEQIRIFTEHKDVLAQEIQDENDRLKEQLRRLISLQDAQISEVAKMLYQQGLTELIHSSPSEQVAYLLVERASLLETSEAPEKPTGDGGPAGQVETTAPPLNTSVRQSSHKGAPRHGQSAWKRLLGLHKASQSKHTFIPAEARHLAGQAGHLEKECSRLERDLEEGSRRLAMAHNEIRRLTDELESAHLTQRTYEPELESAQQEVEQLRQEVEKLKKYEMAELRKAKELNDRLDLEIRALRNRVRSLDTEKSSLQHTVLSLQEQLESAEQQQQQQQTGQVQAVELTQVASLRRKAEQLESVLQQQQLVQANQASELAKAQAAKLEQSDQTCRHLQEKLAAQTKKLLEKEELVESLQQQVQRLQAALQQQQQQLGAVQLQADRADELAKSSANELIQSNRTCRDLQNKLGAHVRSLLENESEIRSLRQQLDDAAAKTSTRENSLQDQQLLKHNKADSRPRTDTGCQLEDDTGLQTQPCKEDTVDKERPDYEEVMKTLFSTREECEALKKEICETLQCLDKERSKHHELKEKHKARLCRAKQKFDDETSWRDEKIKSLERELSFCSHTVTKEKELVMSITVENEKLLSERRRLLQQLHEEEHDKKDSNLTASLSKCRVDFLEMENKKLENKIFHMSTQLAVLERSLQNVQSLQFAEELKKISNHLPLFTPLHTSSVTSSERSDIQGSLDAKQTDATPSPHCRTSGPWCRPAEMGYLNLTSTQSRPDQPAPPAALSSSESPRP
ncbi:coiled-coil domain-containing protein 30 [Stegastes partitus]|uniref:Coiled-coil domain-containing protein 30-like n=1 Tax=Stegastes partitus TaxID=144197 RepID=A0A3B4ZM72_9TELE|nr:PREDICTED: coiled-coil domain-containing protein 30-like [Stegastes partitus]